VSNFQDFHLSPKVEKAILALGYEEPTPIQEKAIPPVLEGRDVVGQAQTGTGKTAAFGIPIVERVSPGARLPEALVLTPTRELCLQVAGEIAKLGRLKNVTTLPVYGGQSIERQVRALRRGVAVVIGTPGRILDHLQRGTLKLERVKVVVLDEADEMLDMGFIDDIENILAVTPKERQTLLFSATIPEQVVRLAQRHLSDPLRITVNPEAVTVPQITQVYYEMRGHDKVDALCRILDMEEIDKAIVFCRTKKGADELAQELKARGYLAEAIHGDLSQYQRERVMRQFREGQVELLVATDVAARGLDISNVSHVINFDMPQDPESYVHRIGRTGRAGRSGEAITLVHPMEFRQLRQIERVARTRIQRRELPTIRDLIERRREVLKEKLKVSLTSGDLADYRQVVAELLEEQDVDSVDVAAAALKLWAKDLAPEEDQFGDTGGEPGMVRLFLNVGRSHGIGPADVVRTVAEECGIPGNVVGLIKIFDRFTFVEVPKDVAQRVIETLNQTSWRGTQLNVEPARPRG
jgi:ATP-dependent RNA helicase DeaD